MNAMQDPLVKLRREALLMRLCWMLLFFLAWQVAEVLLFLLIVAQLLHRLLRGRAHVGLMAFGDALSRYLAQIGRYGSFHSDEKPWPFADWPRQRPAQVEADPQP